MKKFAVQTILLLIVIAVALYLYNPKGGIKIGFPFLMGQSSIKQVQINENVLKVEIADTKDKRSKGLGGKEKLASDEGMLFIFPELKKHSFWMKGLKFPLDFIWIKGNSIVDIIKDVPPPGEGQKDEDLPIYLPITEVDKVLEVNAQTVDRLGIKVGDDITISDILK